MSALGEEETGEGKGKKQAGQIMPTKQTGGKRDGEREMEKEEGEGGRGRERVSDMESKDARGGKICEHSTE